MQHHDTTIVAARPHLRGLTAPIILALLMGHFALVQLATGIQYGDAPRNLHWGLLTWENPSFLAGAPDLSERIKGFPPDPPTLSERGLWRGEPGGLHPWWGPVTPLLIAGVWGLTRSYIAIQTVIPLAAGVTVLITYQATRRLLGAGPALLAAAFLSCFPLFRDYGTVGYNEALGAMFLAGALFTYLSGRTALTVILGTLAALTKMDLLAIYLGTLTVCALYDRVWGGRELPWRHHVIALAGPLLLAAPWVWLHYLGGGQRGPTRPLSARLFTQIFPQMLGLTFYIPWYGALITFAAIGAAVVVGLRAHALPPLPIVVCGTWLGLSLAVLLVYCATPGAGNSPRVAIPGLPALALLFAAGFGHLTAPWRRRVGFYLVVLFTLINLVAIGYQSIAAGIPIRSAGAAFAELRGRERGFVLTPRYWETILYTRQPATWFEADPTFERNMMSNAGHFARYLATNPIRYVLLPEQGDPASPEVRAFLDSHAERMDLGEWDLWTLP